MGYFEVNKVALKVITTSGFDANTGSNVTETKLLYDNNELNAPTFFFNSGFDGIDFEISVLIREDYYYNGRSFIDYLRQWDKWNTVVSVVTDAMVVPNGKYVMTIKDMSQKSKQKSIWKLRFKQYYENSLSFESMFNNKTSSLSSIDQTLVKYQEIDYYSPKEAILALQQKLQQKGCWDSFERDSNGQPIIVDTDEGPDFKQRVPTGVWDSRMREDIANFQYSFGLDVASKQGKCDKETISAMIGDDYEDQGFFDYTNREIGIV